MSDDTDYARIYKEAFAKAEAENPTPKRRHSIIDAEDIGTLLAQVPKLALLAFCFLI